MSNFFLGVVLAGLLLFTVAIVGLTSRQVPPDSPAYTATARGK